MKIATHDLEKCFLDFAVATALNLSPSFNKTTWDIDILVDGKSFKPSQNWDQGGPIIEDNHIEIVPIRDQIWEAIWWDHVKKSMPIKESGFTILEAAMRCVVKAKIGNEVNIEYWMT